MNEQIVVYTIARDLRTGEIYVWDPRTSVDPYIVSEEIQKHCTIII